MPDGAQLPPAAARRRTGDRQLPPTTCETQRQLKRRRHGAAPRSRRSALRGVFPLSAAQHGPRHSMQRATAGQDKGVLAGSYRERRYCSIAKRLSPAARSLPSPPLACCPLPPAPPPPAAAAAADSRRRPPPGRAGSASSLRDRSTALRPARPAPLRHSPAHGAGSPGRPPARPPSPSDPRLPPCPALRRARRPAGGGTRPQLARRVEGLGPPLPGREGEAPPPVAALAEAMK